MYPVEGASGGAIRKPSVSTRNQSLGNYKMT